MIVGDTHITLKNEDGQLRVEALYRAGPHAYEISVLLPKDRKATVLGVQQQALRKACKELEAYAAALDRELQP